MSVPASAGQGAAGEDTELRELVLEALERSGSLAKIRALLRANVLLAFEQEREPRAPRHNLPLDAVLRTREGALGLALVAEFLEFCNLKNSSYVYAAESRQGRGYRYDGRQSLLQRLAEEERAAEREPVLVSILRRALTGRRRKGCAAGDRDVASDDSPNGNELGTLKKDDDNCTYIVHDDSGSVASGNRSQSDNSTDEKNKLLLRLSLDNSDTDTSSDSAREKTSSEYIPNENIQLDMDSEDENKNLHLILSPRSYVEDSSNNMKSTITKTNEKASYKDVESNTLIDSAFTTQNATYVNEQVNIMNSSDSTSYLEIKSKSFLPKTVSNGEPKGDSPNDHSIQDISENIEDASQEKYEPNNESLVEVQSYSVASKSSLNDNSLQFDLAQGSPEKSSEKQSSSKKTETKSEVKSYNYSEDFSPIQESVQTTDKVTTKHFTPKSTDSESIQEEISLNGKGASIDSPGRKQQNSPHSSSISLSDIQDLIENSTSTPSSNAKSTQHKSINVKKSNTDEKQRPSVLQSRKDQRMSSTKNSSDEISDSPIQSLSNISLEYHSD